MTRKGLDSERPKLARGKSEPCAVCGAPFIPWLPDPKTGKNVGGPLLWFCSENCRQRAEASANQISHAPDPKLPQATNYCHCAACGEYFRSPRAFDKHRAGEVSARYCLTRTEMPARGLELHSRGYWRFASEGNPWVAGNAAKRPIAGTLNALREAIPYTG